MVVTSAAFGLAQTGLELVLIRFVQGIGSTVSWIAAFAWLLEQVAPDRRGEAIGRGYGVSMVGSLLGPALAPLVPELGSRSAFLVVSAVFGALFLGFLRFPGPAIADIDLRAGLRLLFRLPGVLLGFWLLTLQAVLFGALGVLGPLHLADLGVAVLAISIVYLVTGGLAIGISPLAGRWSDRRGRLEPMRYALAVAVAGLAVLPLVPGASGYAIALVSVSLVLFLLSAPASALVTDAVEARELGFALGWAVVLLGWGPGSVVGAVGAGWLIEAAAQVVPYLIMSGLCGLALVALLRRPAGRLHDEGPPLAG
jgi:YNFM family putative membrane transporter